MRLKLTTLLLFCLVINKPVYADSACQNEVFGQSNISIDQTAETANEAQRLSMIDAHQQAFQTVLSRLLLAPLPEGLAVLPESLVELVHIRTETSLPGRYIAEIDICFSPDQMRALFAEADLAWAEVTSPLILILPVFADGAGTRAWQISHPWLSLWRGQAEANTGLLRYDTLEPTLVNERQIKAEKLLQADKSVLQKAISRTKAAQILWARALVTLKDGEPQLDMQALLFDREGNVIAPVADRVFKGARADYDAQMMSFSQEVAEILARSWQKANLREDGVSNTLVAQMSFASHQEWLAKKQSLESLPVIKRVSTLMLAANKQADDANAMATATILIDMNGSVEALRYALSPLGYSLSFTEDKAVISE